MSQSRRLRDLSALYTRANRSDCHPGSDASARETRMKAWGLILSIAALCAACTTSGASPWMTPAGAGVPAAPVRDLDNAFRADASVDVIRGTFAAGRQPDGNTVVLASSDGLIVFDTGRHPAHTRKIIDHADAQRRPVVAIFNSHWHL